jgi:uroporphyrin-III C-methyltransferase/precorrin-2 dehydrogenase/sirohydrochlorin ferrochelatase
VVRNVNLNREIASVSVYPVFLKLEGRRALVVGAGRVAAGKIAGLLNAGALVTVVAPDVSEPIRRAPVQLRIRPFEPADLDGVCFVVAAAPPDINRAVAAAAHARGLLVNAVDDVENASAYAGAVLERAGITIALSTDGAAPALAGLLREALEAVLPHDLDAWMDCARDARRKWLAEHVPMKERRSLLLDALVKLREDAHAASACGPSEARSRRARASGGGAPRAVRKETHG